MKNEFLKQIEKRGIDSKLEKLYLWPSVDMWKLTSKEIQGYITQRVGVSDYEVENPQSRPYRIIHQISQLIKNHRIPGSFSLLDITFGDGINLLHMKNAFPEAHLYGIDCCTGFIDSHEKVSKAGVHLYRGYIQHLFMQDADVCFDIIVMLNTYREWASAKLREEEKMLPLLADRWFEKNGRVLILTATTLQIKLFKKRGYQVIDLGKGEEQSRLICLSKKMVLKTFFGICITKDLFGNKGINLTTKLKD